MDGSRNVVTTVRVREVGLEDVAAHEAGARADAGLCGLALRVRDESAVIFDAARAEAALRCRNHEDAIAGSQVDQPVLRRDLRQVEHRLDERRRGRHPLDVLARLVQPRRVELTTPPLSTGGADRDGHEDEAKGPTERDASAMLTLRAGMMFRDGEHGSRDCSAVEDTRQRRPSSGHRSSGHR